MCRTDCYKTAGFFTFMFLSQLLLLRRMTKRLNRNNVMSDVQRDTLCWLWKEAPQPKRSPV